MPQLDLYNFFSIIFYSILGILILFIFFQKHWLYSWKLLTLIPTILLKIKIFNSHLTIKILTIYFKIKHFNIYNFLITIFSTITQRFYTIYAEVEKRKSPTNTNPNILLFWGFLVIVIVVNIYFGHTYDGGGPGGGSETTTNSSLSPPPILTVVQQVNVNAEQEIERQVLLADIPRFGQQILKQLQPQIIQQVTIALENVDLTEGQKQKLQNQIINQLYNQIFVNFLDNLVIQLKQIDIVSIPEHMLQEEVQEYFNTMIPIVMQECMTVLSGQTNE